MVSVAFSDVYVDYQLASSSRNKFFPSLFHKRPSAPIKSALNGINVNIEKGDFVGLVGRNGSGKTTFLKLIAEILRPSSGNIEINGTVGSLFSAVPFINYNLSPKENIIQYCQLTGLSRAKTEKLTLDIEEFTELGEYFEQPLFFGSAGMITRFNFALLTSEPKDILVIDEGIGAGDQFFQKKAEMRLGALYEKASILVMASHSTEMIERFCNKCLIIDQGKIELSGDVGEVMQIYRSKI